MTFHKCQLAITECICLYIPPLWFKIMDKKLLDLPHINGDLSKANVQPKRDPINLKRVINQIRNKFSLINLR